MSKLLEYDRPTLKLEFFTGSYDYVKHFFLAKFGKRNTHIAEKSKGRAEDKKAFQMKAVEE